MIHVLYPILLTITLSTGEIRYIAAKSQLAGMDLVLQSWSEGEIKRIDVSIAREDV